MREGEREEFLRLIHAELFLPNHKSLYTGNDRDDLAIGNSWWNAFRDYPMDRIRRAIPIAVTKCRGWPGPPDLRRALEEVNAKRSMLDTRSQRCTFTSGDRRCPLRGTSFRIDGDHDSGRLCEAHHDVRASIKAGIAVLDAIEEGRPPRDMDPQQIELARELVQSAANWEERVRREFGSHVLAFVQRYPVPPWEPIVKQYQTTGDVDGPAPPGRGAVADAVAGAVTMTGARHVRG